MSSHCYIRSKHDHALHCECIVSFAPVSERAITVLRRVRPYDDLHPHCRNIYPCLFDRAAWTVGMSLFVLIWGVALAGILFSFLWINAPRWLSTSLYLFMGWIAVAQSCAGAVDFSRGDCMAPRRRVVLHRSAQSSNAVKKPRSFARQVWLSRTLAYIRHGGNVQPFHDDAAVNFPMAE